jgi:hypothetical protein
MKKNYFFTLLLTFCVSLFSLAQGTETFTNSSASSSYGDGSFTGDDGVTWSFVASRDANGDTNGSGISLPALMLRRSSDDSKVTSGTISGGIGDFSVKLYKGFTGGGDRQVELFINGVSRGTSDAFDDFDEHIFSISGINITGDFTLELKNTTGKQVIVDDISWTSPSTDPSLSIVSPSDNTVFSANTAEVTVDLSVSNFTLSGDNGSQMTNNIGDGYILGTFLKDGIADGTKNIFSDTFTINSLDPGSTYKVTLELVDNNGVSLSPKIEEEISFSIELPCDIQVTDIATTCDTNTINTDSYTTTFDFTGGNTGTTYTITAKDENNNDVGTIAGDNPDTTAAGTITVSGVAEGVDFTLQVVGNQGSSCDFTRNVTSPTCIPAPTCPAEGAIVITEIMQNPNNVSDNNGEYFEVYNSTDASIDLLGWTISTFSSGTPVTDIISSSVVVPAKGYVVLGENADINTNGGVAVDYQYNSSLFLGNSASNIKIECSSTVFDLVAYDGGTDFPDPTGKSMELAMGKLTTIDNDNGANWGEAIAEISSGGDLGTPGAANSFTLSITKNNIEGFTTYPNPVTNNRFTITSKSAVTKQIAIFNVLGKQVFSKSISGTKSNVDISSIATGLYILKVTEGTKTATSKLVVK